MIRERAEHGSNDLHLYPTWGEFLAAASKTTDLNDPASRRDGGWSDLDAWDESIGFATVGGWEHPALSTVEPIRTAVRAKVAAVGVTTDWTDSYGYSGMSPDVGLYLSGEPCHMVDYLPRETTRTGRVVRVRANIAVNCDVECETMIRTGAAVLALVDGIVAAGMSPDVTVVLPILGGNRIRVTAVKVLEAGRTVDRSQLVFALAHPAVLRRFQFSVMEQWSKRDREQFRVGAGYGSAVRMPTDIAELVPADIAVDQPIRDSTDPEQWVLGQLRDVGLLDG